MLPGSTVMLSKAKHLILSAGDSSLALRMTNLGLLRPTIVKSCNVSEAIHLPGTAGHGLS